MDALDAFAALTDDELDDFDDAPPPVYGPPPITDESLAELRRHVGEDDDELPERGLLLPPGPAWYDDAACDGMDPEVFFDGTAETVAAVKAVCASCPALEACRAEAVADPSLQGVWGGLTAKERAAARAEDGVTHRPSRRPQYARPRRLKNARDLKPCGTEAAYQRHRRAGETPCDDCRAARSAGDRARRERAAVRDQEAA